MTLKPKVVVVGGNGFIGGLVARKLDAANPITGSAVCRIALCTRHASNKHQLVWATLPDTKGPHPILDCPSRLEKKATRSKPDTFASHLDGASGVVHTLGILLEDAAYKRAVRDGNVPALLTAFFGRRNPLEPPSVTYESMNRDSALSVCETFIASKPPAEAEERARPFVFISAEDVFRPWGACAVYRDETGNRTRHRSASRVSIDAFPRRVFATRTGLSRAFATTNNPGRSLPGSNC
ncbi:adenylate kinase [Mycena chlorophos]|uniref:Adenylate kinase n=1 Tax=Mycena chlorophos TaxID=658473 RepID=A0A8H6WMP6_MYCCL|nr:adenylate kinase [Mycena chlorophos]